MTSRHQLESREYENSQLRSRLNYMPEESSKLADEVISLRTNLDKSVSKIQRLKKLSTSEWGSLQSQEEPSVDTYEF